MYSSPFNILMLPGCLIASLLGSAIFFPGTAFPESIASETVVAEEIIKSNGDFLKEHIPDESAPAHMLIIDEKLKSEINAILGHPYPALRIRYWQENNKTLWILEEIGKVKPITAGFVVADNRLIDLQILVYRESRGYEVKYPFFREQFFNAHLNAEKQLSAEIDNITGATLSVNALKRLARLALRLHQIVTDVKTEEIHQ